MARRFVEARHEAKLEQRVIDVRPVGVQYGEWLSKRMNLVMVVTPLLFVAFLVPFLTLPLLICAFIHVVAYRINRPQLPFRYPSPTLQKNLKGTGKHAKSKAKKVREAGILLLGHVDSDSEYERAKEIWLSDDDLRKHMLIIGSTGSGKSETLKGIFFNSLCWSSGYFIADGKADNKLPTDAFTHARSFGRDDSLLFLNFLLAGNTPEKVRKSRRRRTNKINPVSSADADTVIQMGANLLPKVEGDGKNWQEKALNLWRAVIQALCYLRDNEGMYLSISTIIDYLSLPKVEELYMLGFEESRRRGEWSHGFVGVKAYLESGCPGYRIEKLLAKHGHGLSDQPPAQPGGRQPAGGGKSTEQDPACYEQHAYRTSQLMPVLNLLDKTYGFIFRDKYPEIDMVDVALNNRILVMMIPSLEKSAQEAENLGKLAIACLRVMMAKNLGGEIEGTRRELLESKATKARYPFLVALDELAYYFSDGIAVMFAQARSLGMCMIAAAQDLEKLTEGNRAAEAGAMMANQVSKNFMRIDDANKTYEFIKKMLGTVYVAVRRSYELGGVGVTRTKEIEVTSVDRATLGEMKSKQAGEGIFDATGTTVRNKSFYVGRDLEEHANDHFFVLRFLQVEPPTVEQLVGFSTPLDAADDRVARGRKMVELFTHKRSRSGQMPPLDPVISAVSIASKTLGEWVRAPERSIALYMAAKEALLAAEPDVADPAGEQSQADRAGVPKPAGAKTSAANGAGGTNNAALLNRAGSDASATAASRTSAATAAEVEDAEVNILDFLDGAAPFERKPAELLLGGAPVSPVAARSSASHGAVAGGAAPVRKSNPLGVEFDELDMAGDASFASGQGEIEADAVERFIGAGKTLNLRRLVARSAARDALPPAELDAASTVTNAYGISVSASTAASLSEMANAMEAIALATLEVGEREAHSRPTGGSARSAMPGMEGLEPAAADGAAWISEAVTAASIALDRKTEGGQTIVGFSQETLENVEGIEEELGSQAPALAARRLEVIVSERVTPEPGSERQLENETDFESMFDDILKG